MADTVCTTGAELNTAIGAANPGDTITCTAGNTFSRTGAFTLGNRGATAANPITIRTSQYATLPVRRMQPGDAARMPNIQSTQGNTPIFTLSANADGWVLLGLQISTTATQTAMIAIGSTTETVLANQPDGITIDRCYIHGSAGINTVRGIDMEGSNVRITRCWITDIWTTGQECQALWTCNGPGPFLIEDNWLSAMGEVFMTGGADPAISNLIPSDFTIRYNTFSVPLTKNQNNALYDGVDYVMKNIFELKNARRVLVEFNLFENSWVDGQDGTSVLMTPRNQSAGAPWCTVEDVTFRYNIFRHIKSWINILTTDNLQTTDYVKRLRFQHNLVYDVNPADAGSGVSKFIQILGVDGQHGFDTVEFDHNTFDASPDSSVGGAYALSIVDTVATVSPLHASFTYTNNLFKYNTNDGVIVTKAGSSSGVGTAALTASFSSYTYANNLVFAGDPNLAAYPANTWKETSSANVGFQSYAGNLLNLTAAGTNGDYRAGGSRQATDSTDLGANVALVQRRVLGRHALGQGW